MTTTPPSRVTHPVLLSAAGFTLACMWPGAVFVARNMTVFTSMDSSAVRVVAAACAGFWLAGVASCALPALLSTRWPAARAFSVLTIAVFAVFAHQDFRTWLLDTMGTSGVPARLVYLALLLAVVALTWVLSRRTAGRLAIVLVAAFMLVPPAGRLIRLALAAPGPAAGNDAKVLAPDESRPLSNQNVYFVILDEYGGRPALRKYVAFDNEGFVAQMAALGFTAIDDARSNYMTTHLSLMSTIEMTYVVDESSPRYTSRRLFFPYAFQLGPLPRLVRQLSGAGYDFLHIGNQWAPCLPRAEVRCLADAGNAGFRKYIMAVFMAPTRIPLGRLGLTTTNWRETLTATSQSLNGLTLNPRPFFAFIHVLSPHTPYRRADCSTPRGDIVLSGRKDPTGKEGYRHSIRCLNVEVLALAQDIRAVDPNAIVVFQADHGSGFEVNWRLPLEQWSDAAIDERSSILNLVHVPDACLPWVRPGLSPINTMRLVVGCLERRAPDYVDDRTFINTYEDSPDFGLVHDVTDRLHGLDESSGPGR